MKPLLSAHFQSRSPSAIRSAQIEFNKRTDGVQAINVAIGNVSLPMPKFMQQAMFSLKKSPFRKGVVDYTTSDGTTEAKEAFLKFIRLSGGNTDNLHVLISEGGSLAMELVVLGTTTKEKPLLLIDPAYTNYNAFAKRLGLKTVSLQRTLQENGEFTLPEITEIEKIIQKEQPNALVIIPYDNPTGQFFPQETLVKLAQLAVQHNLWLVSDEAYRGLNYNNQPASSIWCLTETEVPGITGRRVSIESTSKVWNACGLRIGAIVTDNLEFYEKALAETTANLSCNSIGQHIFASLLQQPDEVLKEWLAQQKNYYAPLMQKFTEKMKKLLPGIIISQPEAALYSVVDVRKIAPPDFKAKEFVLYCAQKGQVNLKGIPTTLLVATMEGFYAVPPGEKNPGSTQMRIAYVAPPKEMKLVPKLFAELFKQYLQNHP